jgi:uncharacterized membrane protein
MESAILIRIIDFSAQCVEFVGILVIGIAFIYAAVRALGHYKQKRPDPYLRLKAFIGKALQLGLEFLVAADIIRTVTVAPTMEGILSLGLLILIRTFLSWSIAVELEGCWPWQVASKRKDRSNGTALAKIY